MLCIVEAVLLLLQWRGLKEYADIMALDYVSNYTRNKEIHFFALFYFLLCYTKARRVGGSGGGGG